MRKFAALSDEALLTRLQTDDEEAFTEVYNRYWQKLLAIGYFHTRHKQEAEDIVHEVMMSLWTRRNDLTINSLEAYLATAVKFSVFKSILREKRRRDLATENSSPVSSPSIEDELEARALEEFMRGEIEKLPPKSRLVFRYSREAELTINEIAGKMDLSPKGVEYHMTRALKSLREALKKIKLFFV